MTGTSGDEKNTTNWSSNLTRSLLCHFRMFQYAFKFLPLKQTTQTKKRDSEDIIIMSGCVDSDKWLKLVVNKLNGIHEEVGLGQRERRGGFQ